MPEQIPAEVISDRYSRLHQHLNEVSQSINEAVIGDDLEVLVTDIDGERGSGKSRDFRLVHFNARESDLRPGDLVTVRIDSAKPHFVFSSQAPKSITRTRGGDAFAARRAEAEATGVMLGMPTLKSTLPK
jgi:tRNA-2-methylthio-N6-dimethylallyladenosine synthase